MADKRIVDLAAASGVLSTDIFEKSDATAAIASTKMTTSQLQTYMQGNLHFGVTSVGLSMPDGFSVSGTPITSAGTFAVTTDWKINLNRTSPQIILAFNTARRPSLTNDVEIAFSTTFTVSTLGGSCSITLQISPDGTTWQTVYGSSRSEPTASEARAYSKTIQRGYFYRIINGSIAPSSTSLSAITELSL